MKTFRYLLLILITSLLAACGGGGGGGAAPTPRTVTLKLSTTGTPSTSMVGIGIKITLPSGVTPALNADGSVAASVVAISGVVESGAVITPVYVAASGATLGTLQFAVATSAAGFNAGEFATVVLNLSASANPVLADFILSNFNPIPELGVPVTGLTAVVASSTIL
ncbi:MAG: hypothetical protein HGB32_02645 [Geobacteraceae bacterium]|nr:hypothetical protein [Geobacteraceae bacterium]NTW79032.1 hypothetical protein [Geobacteraceae bacterium]